MADTEDTPLVSALRGEISALELQIERLKKELEVRSFYGAFPTRDIFHNRVFTYFLLRTGFHLNLLIKSNQYIGGFSVLWRDIISRLDDVQYS